MTTFTAVQFAVGADGTPEQHLERLAATLDGEVVGTDVVCLPEYWATSYFPAEQDPDAFDLAVTEDGPFVTELRSLAEANDVALVVPVFEEGERGGRYYNAAFVIDRTGELRGKYRKMHPFQRPDYNEAFYFAPGNLGVPTFELGGITVGIMICYDRHFPEIARVAALRGADVILVPTCSFGEENRDETWVSELTGIAVSNSVYVVGVNRAGSEGDKTHFGATTAIDPMGELLGRLDKEPGLLTVDLDQGRVTAVRRTTKHLNDIRDELLPRLDEL